MGGLHRVLKFRMGPHGIKPGLGSGLGLGSPSWFTRSVLQQLFRSQGREKILAASSTAASNKQQAAASSSKQATELISAYSHIFVIIDGTSPKLSWYIVLMMPYNPTKFQVKTTKGQGRWAKKSEKSRKSGKVKPGQGAGVLGWATTLGHAHLSPSA